MNDSQLPSNEASAPAANLVEGLLSNPALLGKLGAVLGNLSAASGGGETAATESTEAAPPALPPGLFGNAAGNDGIASLLSNPALLENLPQILSVMKPMLAAAPPPKPPATRRDPISCRDELLLALKPFLSPERCRAIDMMIRLSRLGTVFRQLQ